MVINLILLSGVLVSALSALFCRQTIYALLFLMSTFIMSALFFGQLQVYFIGAILIIVYVGAITMLFLYVIMFLDIKKHKKILKNSGKYSTKFIFVLGCTVSGFITLTNSEEFLLTKSMSNYLFFDFYKKGGDILMISQTLYSHYGSLVLVVGFLLFIVIVIATDVSKPDSPNMRS